MQTVVQDLAATDRGCYQRTRMAHWDTTARRLDTWNGWGGYYQHRLMQIYQFLVPPQRRVLEIGCGSEDLLAALKPTFGVGVDFSGEMLKRARSRHPGLHFVQADAHALSLDTQFDYIILSDLLNDLWDVQPVLEQVRRISAPHSRVILNSYSRLWELPLALAERLALAKPNLDQNWLTVDDIASLLNLADLEVIRAWPEICWPLPTPLLDNLFNRGLVRFSPFRLLALTNFIVARPRPQQRRVTQEPLVSVIIPARNEAGNIPQAFARMPEMGRGTELVFIEGHSKDNTWAVIEQSIRDHPERRCKLLRQVGIGKGDAVRLGFSQAAGDILMILDADLTVPPEDLPRFFKALCSGKGDFINGVRLVYPMAEQAMRFLNLLGNKFFSLAFTWLLGQPIKDTLCGTKALWKTDYEQIVANRAHFGDFDPFGDFDLLFGAAKLNLRILDLPVRYHSRTYGTTNISRWKHGWHLLEMVIFAAGKIKFV